MQILHGFIYLVVTKLAKTFHFDSSASFQIKEDLFLFNTLQMPDLRHFHVLIEAIITITRQFHVVGQKNQTFGQRSKLSQWACSLEEKVLLF